jgi:alkylation response protein AidB-like acyl-CoA dehydrogenase
VDFELDADQGNIVEAIESLLARHAGPERAIELAAKGGYDTALEQALAEAGYLGLARDVGPLEAALLVEAVARAGGVVAVAAAALVAPLVAERELAGPVALVEAASGAPARYAAQARTLLVLDGDEARIVLPEPGDVAPLESSFGFPMGRVAREAASRGESLGSGRAERLRAAWRVALAVETAGTLAGALQTTLDYVKQRRQFGRAIGSFQGVQHRLAHCAVQVAGARWLALESAWQGAPQEGAAIAAGYAAAAAKRIFDETHQFCGAMGFTREHELHVWSMRLQALRLELGGVASHRSAAAGARWQGAA